MTEVTDEFMQQMLGTVKNYSVVLLKAGPNIGMQGVEAIIWEHARRNFSLRADGILAIVGPIAGEGALQGIGIFNATPDETKVIMNEDPGVKEGVFVYEVYSCRSFPGDKLPS